MSLLNKYSTESISNTSTTPLAGLGTYTGDFQKSYYQDVIVSFQADTDCEVYFDFSVDGVNVNTFPVFGYRSASGIQEFHSALKGPRFFRLRIVNESASPQTYLRAYTYFGQFSKLPNSPLNQTISTDSDAILVRTVDIAADLAAGNFQGIFENTKFGIVQNIEQADTPTDIWLWGSDDVSGSREKTFLSSPETFYIASDNASDTDVDVTVDLNDADNNIIQTTVNLNGQTPISLDSNLDCNRLEVTGSTTPLGNIYVTFANNFTNGVPNDPTQVQAYMGLGFNKTQQAIFRVPTGVNCNIKSVNALLSRLSGIAGSAQVRFEVKKPGGVFITDREFELTSGYAPPVDTAGLYYEAGTIILLKVLQISDNNTNFSGSFSYDLIDEKPS